MIDDDQKEKKKKKKKKKKSKRRKRKNMVFVSSIILLQRYPVLPHHLGREDLSDRESEARTKHLTLSLVS